MGVRAKGWAKIRLAVLERDCYTCQYCRAPATEVDHIVPRKHGGGEDMDNLVASCVRCNRSKGAGVAPKSGAKAFFGGTNGHPPAGRSNSPMRRIGPDGQEFETE